MIRLYYSIDDMGIYLNQDNKDEVIYVKDGQRSLVVHDLERILLYSSIRRLTIDELLNDQIIHPVFKKHPWDQFGTIPMSHKDHIKNSLKLFWFESHWGQAYDSYEKIKNEMEKQNKVKYLCCDNGPAKGDLVRILDGESRVSYENHVYQRNLDKLEYVRPYEANIMKCL